MRTKFREALRDKSMPYGDSAPQDGAWNMLEGYACAHTDVTSLQPIHAILIYTLHRHFPVMILQPAQTSPVARTEGRREEAPPACSPGAARAVEVAADGLESRQPRRIGCTACEQQVLLRSAPTASSQANPAIQTTGAIKQPWSIELFASTASSEADYWHSQEAMRHGILSVLR